MSSETTDVKAQLAGLVAGEWTCADAELGGLREHWRGHDLPTWLELLVVREQSGDGWVAALWTSRSSEPPLAHGRGPDPVSALSALCCQPLAVSILHGLGSFPEVTDPDPSWPWWWCNVGRPWALVEVAAERGIVSFRWCGDHDDEWMGGGALKWRRAPAPPGWQP